MSSTLLDQIAPKANFWSHFFLRRDDCCSKTATLDEKKLEMKQKCEKILAAYYEATLEDKRKIGKRLKARRFEIASCLTLPSILQIFKRLFSPYSSEELHFRELILRNIISVINRNENYEFCKRNAPVEYEMPERARYKKDGYYCKWQDTDGNKKLTKVKTAGDLIRLGELIYIQEELVNSGVKIEIVDDAIAHANSLNTLNSVYVDYNHRIVYPIHKNGKNTDCNCLQPKNTKYYSKEQLTYGLISAYNKIYGYNEIKESLTNLFPSYLVKEPPSGPYKDLFDFQIYFPENNREGVIHLYTPHPLNGVHSHQSFEYDAAMSIDKLMHIKSIITESISSCIKAYHPQHKLLNAEGLLEGKAQLQLHMLTPTGSEEKIIDLPSHKLTKKELQNLIHYKKPSKKQVQEWEKNIDAFKQLCEEQGYLYTEDQKPEDRYLIRFEDVPHSPLPYIYYVRIQECIEEGIRCYSVSDEEKINVLSEEALQYAKDMEAKFATEKRLQTSSLNSSSFYYKSHRVLPGGKQLELCLKGFTSHKDDFEYRTIDINSEDTKEDLETNIKKTIRSYRIYLNKLLNDIEPKAIQVVNEQDVDKQSNPDAALIIIKKDAIEFDHPYLQQQKKLIKNYSKKDFFREITHLKKGILLGEAVNKFVHDPDNQFSIKSENLINILPNTPETIILFSQNKIGYFDFSIDTLTYKVYFRNPSDLKRILKFEIENRAQLKLLNKARKEIENFKLSVNGFLKKRGSLTHSQIPAPVEIDKTLISTYYTAANFVDKGASNYYSPVFGDVNIANSTMVKNKIQLFHNNLKQFPHIKALYTNIMDSIQKMPDERDRMQYALEVVAAICYCETKHESVFISIYNILHADAPISSDEEYDYYQKELAVANEMKRGAVVEMAGERLIDGSENNQSVHTEKRYVQMLESQGIHIPLSEMNTTRTEEFTLIGNYKDEKDILEGFLNVLNVAHVISVYHERHNQALHTEDLHAVNSQLDLMYSYLETNNADIQELQSKKRKALKDLRETSYKEREAISQKLQADSEEKIPTEIYWKAYKKSKINEIETSASSKRRQLLDDLACKQSLLKYNDNGDLVKFTRKGTIAILQAMGFLEER